MKTLFYHQSCEKHLVSGKEVIMRLILVFSLLIVFLLGCKKDKDQPITNPGTWDIEAQGIPRFVNFNYIELDKIFEISKYRSSFGHDYSDGAEHCRSMKHYFEPYYNTDWSTIKVYSPVTGTIKRMEQEWAGTKFEIESKDYPAFRFTIFHVNPIQTFSLEDPVVEGQQLGTQIGNQTMSDIAVWVNNPDHQGRLVSYFYVITDEVFQQYSSRGVANRDSMVISKELRDSHPLTCEGETFVGNDPLRSFVILSGIYPK